MSGSSVGRITGAALLGGIVGNPVSHSLSPVIHNAWLEAGGVDGAYVAFAPRDAAGFEALVAAGRAGLIAGVNVTAPFKEQAFALADEAAAAARMTAIVAAMPRTALVAETDTTLHFTFTSRIFRFVDDVDFVFVDGRVEYRSASRVGYGDMNVNRARMDAIAAAWAAP